MKTTLQGKFLNKQHEARFNHLIDINGSFANDINYTSAGYLLSADEEVYNKALPFINANGIHFSVIFGKQDFCTGHKALVRYAYDLFTGGAGYKTIKDLTLTDLAHCDADMIPVVFNAILLYLDWDSKAAGYKAYEEMMLQMRRQCGLDDEK